MSDNLSYKNDTRKSHYITKYLKGDYESDQSDDNETLEDIIRREVEEARHIYKENRIELIESFCWNTPRPTTPYNPQCMALCFVLSVADSCFSGNPDVIADTFMERVINKRYMEQIESFIKNWDKITCGNLQKNQIRTQLVRSRFSKIEKDEQFNFLRSMRDVQDSIFLQCVSFDDIIDGKLHIEFSPKCFYCGRKEHVLAHKTFPIVVTCNENFFTSFLRTVLAVNANDELKIDPLHFDSLCFHIRQVFYYISSYLMILNCV